MHRHPAVERVRRTLIWRRRLLAVAAAGVVVSGGLLAWHVVHRPGSDNRGAAAASASSRSPVFSVLPRKWAVGEARTYALDLRSRTTVRSQTLLAFYLTGNWALAAVAPREMRAQLEEARFTSDTAKPADAAQLAAFNRGFLLEHFFWLTRHGAVDSVGMDERMPSFVQNVLRAVIGMTQLVGPVDPAESWEAEERDNVGLYRARYSRLAAGGWQKRKLEYLETLNGGVSLPAGIGRAETKVVSSRCEFMLSAGGVLEELRCEEQTQIESDGPLPPLRSATSLRLSLTGTGHEQGRLAEWRASANAAPRTGISEGATSVGRKADVDVARIGGLTLPDILTGMGRIQEDKDPKRAAKRARLYSALAALLRQQPEAVAQAVARIRSGDPDSNLLLDALGDAGSPEAQTALCELARGTDAEPGVRRRSLTALCFVRQPTEVALQTFSELLDDPELGTQARYGLGAAVHQLQGTDPERAEQALQELTQPLHGAVTQHRLVTDLRALGNAGHQGSLADIEPYLDDPRAAVREAALQAIRRIPGAQVDGYLAAAITGDPARSVRQAAARLAGERRATWPLVTALRQVLMADPEDSVRYAALSVATRWVDTAPMLREPIQWVAEHDSNESVRSNAVRALARSAQAGLGS
jgi:hypothetical protein